MGAKPDGTDQFGAEIKNKDFFYLLLILTALESHSMMLPVRTVALQSKHIVLRLNMRSQTNRSIQAAFVRIV